MTQTSDFSTKKTQRRAYWLSRNAYIAGKKVAPKEDGEDKKRGKKFAKRRVPRHDGLSRDQIFKRKCRLVYLLNDPKIGEGDAVLPGVQLPAKTIHTGSSIPMHTAVSGLAWQAHDRFAQICRMDGSDLVLGKMAIALAPIFDADALAYLAEFDDRAAQIPGRVKRTLKSAMIGKSAFKAHHARVDAARGRVVKRIVWYFVNEAIRTPANTPLLGKTGTIVISNRMGFIADDLFAVLLPEFKKIWAKKNGKQSQEAAQPANGKAGNPKQKGHKLGRGPKSQQAQADLAQRVRVHLQIGD